MIFKPALARAVASGRKTQTRRPVTPKPCRYKVGHDYAVQPGRGKEAIARLKVLDIREERVGQITHQDAKAEGFRNTAAFKAYWVELYDARWLADYMEVHSLDALSEPFLLERFDKRHAHKLVTVITFELANDTPRFLAHPTASSGDYTEQRHRAIDDLEVIDEQTQARYSKDALGFCIGRQLARRKQQANNQAQYEAQRRPMIRRAA